MILKACAGIIAAIMVVGFLSPVVFKLAEIPLYVVVAIGIVMMAVELWESFREHND